MKKFKQFLEELELQEGTGLSADDMVGQKDSDDEGTTLKPRSKGEEDFKNMHMVTKTDYYAAPGQDHVFNGSIKEDVELDEEKMECTKCKGEGKVDGEECGHCDGTGYHDSEEGESEDESYKKGKK